MRRSTLLLSLLTTTLACPRPSTEGAAASSGEGKREVEREPEQREAEPEQREPEQAGDPSAVEARSSEGTFAADPDKSSVRFAVARATVGHIGEFEQFEATLQLAEGRPVGLTITVETGSVVADRAGLTSHLRGADFFEVEKFPTAKFTASEFTADPEAGPHGYRVRGTMVLHGVTRELEFPATLAIESDRVIGRATLDISAKAFGIDYEGMEAELAEDAVQLEIELLFTNVGGASD